MKAMKPSAIANHRELINPWRPKEKPQSIKGRESVEDFIKRGGVPIKAPNLILDRQGKTKACCSDSAERLI